MSLPWEGKPPPLPPPLPPPIPRLPPPLPFEPALSPIPEMPRPPLLPLGPAPQHQCRYHPEQRATGGVNRGWGPDGWVMLCEACIEALKGRQLVVVAPSGGYGGSYPALDRQPGDVEPDEDLFE